jgi:hypothetical protein
MRFADLGLSNIAIAVASIDLYSHHHKDKQGKIFRRKTIVAQSVDKIMHLLGLLIILLVYRGERENKKHTVS